MILPVSLANVLISAAAYLYGGREAMGLIGLCGIVILVGYVAFRASRRRRPRTTATAATPTRTRPRRRAFGSIGNERLISGSR